MNKLKKFVALALVLCMVLTFVPVSVNAASEEFLRVYHLDCGCKFFDTADVEALIDLLAEKGYTHLELALGNDGLRLILDDMSVLDYDSETVAAGVRAGNAAYSHSGEWTQAEMDAIVDYAAARSVEIIPLINTPGHMDAILAAMEAVGIDGAYNGSARTVDVTNAEAVAFTQALVGRYVDYFASRGCTYFNLGADEYANDIYTTGAMGFGHLQNAGLYDEYAAYVNGVAAIIKDAGMTPIAFNDGLYFDGDDTAFDTDIVAAYWTSGWGSYNVASAAALANKGHRILNTNDGWYYVLGRASGTYGYAGAANAVANTPVTDVPGSNDPAVIGAMACLWCDTPGVSYAAYASKVHSLIETLADSNPDYFVVAETPAETTVSENGISVTAEGLTGLTAAEAAAPAIEDAREVLAYELTPVTAEGEYHGEATVALTVPAGWSDVRGGVLASEHGEEVLNISGKLENGTFTFQVPHFSTVVVYDVEPASEVLTEPRTITVSVGGSATDTIVGGEYTADETELDESIATVSVETTPAKEATAVYTEASGLSTGDLISSNAEYRETDYYYLVGETYYPVYATRTNSYQYNRYNYYWYYSADNGATFEEIGSQNNTRTNSDLSITVYEMSGTEAVEASTTVTFRGVAQGTTYVQVGGVYYTINVVDAAPSGAMTQSTLTLEYWITNLPAYTVNGNANSAHSTTISAAAASTEEGVAVTDYAPANTYNNFPGEWTTLYYWQAMRLDADNRQTTGAADDETTDGTTFTHVRYHNGAWQYKTGDGLWHYFLSGDQAVAYYLQKLDVTDQLITYFKDWGYDTGSNTPGNNPGQVALTVAVVDGNTVSPSEEDMYSQSTTIFNYWEGRDIGVVAPVSTAAYEIYKITVTYGERTNNAGSNSWYPRDTITWDKTTNAEGTGEWYDEREVWNISEGTAPVVSGVADNVVWSARDTAVLVLIYVRAKNADLTIQYVDDSNDGSLIYERGIFASSAEGTFFTDLTQTSEVPDTAGTFTLDDDAYVPYTNADTGSVVNQTISKNLLDIQDTIEPQYKSGAYKYVSAELSADGKTLILHYNIDETVLNPQYVIDFGLPVTVRLSDVVQNYGPGVTVEIVSATYGTAALNGDQTAFTYTPNSVLHSAGVVQLKCTYSNGEIAPFRVGFIPATTVYYEESFMDSWEGSWSGHDAAVTGSQELQTALHTSGLNYGYTEKYAAESGMSNGTEAVSSDRGDKAVFSFTGTGVDIYANSTTATGTLVVLIADSNGSVKKLYQVDTVAKSGGTGATDGQDAASSSLPIVSAQGLDYGTYQVTIQHTKTVADSEETIRLDGFRVYNTMGPSGNAYYPIASEANPTFVELRNEVLAALGVEESDANAAYNYAGTILEQVYNAEGKLNGVYYLNNGLTDGEVQDLLNNGPKNELFVWPGDSVTFNVGSARAQIGLKAPMGGTSYTVNGTPYTVTSGTDLFCHPGTTGEVTIVNTGDKVLSLTKIKLVGAAELSAVSADQLVRAMRYMGVVEMPANPFADVAEDSWYYDSVLWALEKGITTGADETHFLPDAVCQRAAVVTFLWRAAGCPDPETAVNPFADVTEDTYYYKAVLWAVENGITNGVDATHFAPFAACNRAQVVTFLWRANGSPAASAANPFVDVAEGQWYTDAVAWALEKGITNGMSSDIFGVESLCNRAQIVTFLYRAAR